MREAAARNSSIGAPAVARQLQEVGPRRVEAVVVAEPVAEAVQQLQPGPRPVGHGHGDRPVEGHHRVAGHPFEQAVERHDLGPVRVGVAGRLVVDGGDGGLHLVLPHPPPAQRLGDEGHALGDEPPVPERPVLLGQGHQLAVGAGAARTPGVGQHHEGEQAGDLGVLGQGRPHRPGQPDGLAGQVGPSQVGTAAAGVALVEQQVEDVQHRPQPLVPLSGGREAERLVRSLDPGLGPADPLRHRRLGDQERRRDLAGGEAADRPQGEGDGRRRREGGVAAHEHEDQRVVLPRGRGRIGGPGTDHEAARSSLRRRASSLRYPSIMRRDATRTSQASGSSGARRRAMSTAAAMSASCTASSALAKSP